MNNTDKEYLRPLKKLYNYYLSGKKTKGDRTGTGTISYFGEQIRFNSKYGFPILTTKNVYFKGVKTELLWFIGNHLKDKRYSKFDRTNIRFLLDNGNHIWSEWPFKNYLIKNNLPIPEINSEEWNTQLKEWENKIQTNDYFCSTWGNLGPVYGKQWMDWGGENVVITEWDVVPDSMLEEKNIEGINQLQNCIDTLKTNPDSRRMVVNAWNVSDLDDMSVSGLPPCHLMYQFYSEELTMNQRVIEYYNRGGEHLPEDEEYWEDILNENDIPTRSVSLQWYQRSCDYFLGIPFNISSYALLLHLVAIEVNMIPGEVIGSLGDTHLYLNHVDQANEQLSRDNDFDLPKLWINPDIKSMFDITPDDIKLKNYQKDSPIKAPIAV
jgi:thymidylate synthase